MLLFNKSIKKRAKITCSHYKTPSILFAHFDTDICQTFVKVHITQNLCFGTIDIAIVVNVAAGVEFDRIEQLEINMNVVGAAAVWMAYPIWYRRSNAICL